MQDCMEIGFTSMAGQGMHVVFHNARGRPLGTFPPTLRKADFGVFQKGVSDASFNYGGNLEVSPPVKVGGKNFPLGRMIYGATGRPGEDMDIDKFLTAQVVQDPVRLDTSWLTVGHVDEILTFLPVGKGGFRLAMASAQRALDILDQLKAAGHGSAPVMKGRQTLHWLTGAPTGSEESTVAAILADPSAMSFNTTVAATLKAERAKLVAGLGLKDADVIELPVLYKENPSAPGLADAMTAGMVNMLVTNGHCAVPKPFGPVVGGMDKFQEEAKAKLSALGLAVEFVDDWFTYHVQLGEVHCGTNTLRREKQFAWWEFEP
jgi:protein-arginine deiminase